MAALRQFAEAGGFLGFLGFICWGFMFLDFASMQ